MDEGCPDTYDITGDITDPDTGHRSSLTYTVNESGEIGLPDFITFDEANEEFTFSPDGDDSGTYTIEVVVTDTLGYASTVATFDVTVNDNVLPTYNVIGDQEFREE